MSELAGAFVHIHQDKRGAIDGLMDFMDNLIEPVPNAATLLFVLSGDKFHHARDAYRELAGGLHVGAGRLGMVDELPIDFLVAGRGEVKFPVLLELELDAPRFRHSVLPHG